MAERGAAPSSRRGPAGTEARHAFSFPSDPSAIAAAVDRVTSAAARAGVTDGPTRLRLRIVAGEALSNAVLHGNGGDPDREVVVQLEVGAGRVLLTVTDEGEGFDPAAVPDPRLAGHRERDRGRGLFLLRTLADDLRHSERGNRLALVMER